MKKIIVFPQPKHFVLHPGELDLSGGVRVDGNSRAKQARRKLDGLLRKLDLRAAGADAPLLRFVVDEKLDAQRYRLTVAAGSIEIRHKDAAGAFYGAVTLGQILKQAHLRLPYLEIDDAPDFGDRGLMLDISRNKVPKLKTLMRLVDFLADVKINQLQLYIEGLSFYYQSFDSYYRNGKDVLTADDIVKLDQYCADRFIELVPNQNSFGHFTEWLAKDEFQQLAELPQTFFYEGVEMLPSCLDPAKEGSIDLVSRLCDDLLPAFRSKKFNVCGDEPFELGMGASKEICAQKGKGKVYLEFMSKVFDKARQHNKTKIMMFGDVIKQDPALIADLPADVIALEWGYNDDSFQDEVCRLYADCGVEYYVCPGTSMWNTVAGKSDFMLANIKGAARHGCKNGARGLLLTDWGDGGTCQQYGLTLFPYGAGAAYAWNCGAEQDGLLCEFLDTFVYLDQNGKTAKLIYALGNYYQQHSVDFNATKIFKMLYIQQTDHLNFGTNYEPLFKVKDHNLLAPEEYQKTKDYLENILTAAQTLALQCDDGALIKEEIIWSASYLIHGCLLGLFMTDMPTQTESTLYKLRDEMRSLLQQYTNIWRQRNKKSAMGRSILRMKSLINKYNALIKSINVV